MTISTSPPRTAPRLSIALGTFNGERYLPEQLDSILRQTCQPYEVVVGDDGSSDGTLKILEKFVAQCAFPVRVIRNEVNLHFTGNFMNIASECTGDYVVFCDQDDVWADTKLAELDASIREQAADLYQHEGLVVDADGIPTGAKLPDHAELRADPESPPYHQGSKGFAMTVRKTVIDEMLRDWDWGVYHEFRREFGSPLGHDQLVYAWCIGRPVVLISKPLTHYRIHATNVTATQTMTGNWVQRLARRAKLIQFAEFNYQRQADKWAAEVVFMERMFPDPPRGIVQLSRYFREAAALWHARAAVHDAHASRGGRWRSFQEFRTMNRAVKLVPAFGRAALGKDLVLTLLRTVAPG